MKSVIAEIADLLRPKPLFEIESLRVEYTLDVGIFAALRGISLKGYPGETLGVVGESGSGKSTLAKALLFLERPTSGRVLFEGKDLRSSNKTTLRLLRKGMQMIFQDPDASLNPRLTVLEHLKEPLELYSSYSQEAAFELLQMVHLSSAVLDKYPHELSGGQKQRVSIARALSVEPRLLVCDEPLASLDLSVSSQIVELLQELQQKKGLAYLFITHDLISLERLAHRIAVLYLGDLVELAPRASLYSKPLHPYTQGLFSAIPIPDPEQEKKRPKVMIQGEIPSALSPPPGCPFHTRCPMAHDTCKRLKPPLHELTPGHFVACHLYSDPSQ